MTISSVSPILPQNTSDITAKITSSTATGGADFSALLQETLEQSAKEQAIALTGGGGAEGLSSGTGSGATALLMGAMAGGDVDQTQIAMFMLLTMMQSQTSENSEMSMLMSMLANLIGQMGETQQTQVYNTTMNSDYSRADLLTVEQEVFSPSLPTEAVTRTAAEAIVPDQSWKAATPAVTGSEESRSADALWEIIDQFDVENAERYRPFKNGATYCNIFVWDVTSALGCEIPHYRDNDTGLPRTYPDVSGAWEMNANATYDWLMKEGGDFGWREVSAEEAQNWANSGGPAVTAWRNVNGKPGHVQIVCPSEDGGFDSVRGVTVAQAGAKVTNYTHISSTFKQSDIKNVKYFIHD